MKKFIITFASILFILMIGTYAFAARGLTVVADLNHKSSKIGTYYALIIGIQNYKAPEIPDLDTPLKDAVDMADILKRKYGFKVELLLDNQATRRGIDSALRKLVSTAQPEDSVLIYYAGHGELDRQYNDGWWIPVDAQAGISVTYIDNVQVQKAMRNIRARHVLLIADSCYSGTLFGQARAMPSLINDKYYLNLYNEKSRWGITSGNKTPVSDSGTGGHSVFAYQLIKKLEKNDKQFISAQEVYISIAPIVANNSEQTPLCRPVKGTGDQGGEFIFISTEKQAPSKPKSSGSSVESLAAERKKIEQERRELEKLKLEIERSKIEQERKELERLRAQIEKEKLEPVKQVQPQKKAKEQSIEQAKIKPEKKTIPLEKKKTVQIQTVKSKPKKMTPTINKNIRARAKKDDQYIKLSNGIVYDEKTGLEWFAGPDHFFHRQEAELWAKELKINGGNWRIPNKEELASIYEKKTGTRNMTPLIETTGWYVWYEESSLQFFSFKDASTIDNRGVPSHCWSSCHRAFAVRKIDPQKKTEIENAKLELAAKSTEENSQTIIEKDGQYIKLANGIVYDEKTGLEWFVGPDHYVGRNEAVLLIKELKLDGGNWRMPKKEELDSIYKNGAGSRNMTLPIETSGWAVWYEGSVLKPYSFWADQTIPSHCLLVCHRVFAVRKISSQKKAQIENAKFEMAATNTENNYKNIIEKDGQYVKYANGIVYDEKTKLEWLAGPDEDVFPHSQHKWINTLKIAGTGWRLPSIKELKTLFKKGAGSRNMTPLLKTNGWLLFSNEQWQGGYYVFDFKNAVSKRYRISANTPDFKNIRIFAVRSVK